MLSEAGTLEYINLLIFGYWLLNILYRNLRGNSIYFSVSSKLSFICSFSRTERYNIFELLVIGHSLVERRHIQKERGARCSSVVRAFADGAMGRRIDPSCGEPIELFLVPASPPRLM